MTTNYYTFGGAILAEETVGGAGYRNFGADALGSVVGTYDSTGKAQNSYRYSPYGQTVLNQTVTSTPFYTWVGSLGYRQTARHLPEFYVRARHYSSAQAQWTTVDPMWPGTGPYSYLNGAAPTVVRDPSGKCAQCEGLSGLQRYYCEQWHCPPDPCSTYPGGPCAYAAHIGDDKLNNGSPAGGGVVCCGGRAYPCVWDKSPYQPIKDCILFHEARHILVEEGGCPTTGYARQKCVSGPTCECIATAAEVRCLRDKRNQGACGNDPGCLAAIHNRICQQCGYMKSNGCPLPPYCSASCPPLGG